MPVGTAERREVGGVEERRPRRRRRRRDLDLEHGVVARGQLVERALGDGATAVDDHGVLAQVLDEVELV